MPKFLIVVQKKALRELNWKAKYSVDQAIKDIKKNNLIL